MIASASLPLIAASLGSLLCTLASYWLGQGNEIQAIGTWVVIQFMAMSFCMLMAWYFTPDDPGRNQLAWLLLIGIVARICLVGVDSYTSNDVSRYMFDGKIVLEGLDPYRVNHQSPELVALREVWQPPPEHAKYVTLYPPMALSLFAVSAMAGPVYAPLVWKLIVIAASVVTLLLVVSILRALKQLKHTALIALSPLMIIEPGVGGHLDSMSALAVAMAIWAWGRQALFLSGAALAMGVLLKLLPGVLLLPLLIIAYRRQRWRALLGGFVLVLVGAYAAALLAGWWPVGSLGVFFEKWRFGSPWFQWLESWSGDTFVSLAVSAAFICVMMCVLLFFSWRYIDTASTRFYLQLQYFLVLPLLFSPVVFPWYLLPLIPLLAIRPNVFVLAWVTVLPLTYEVLTLFNCCQRWEPAQWPLFMIGLAQLLGLVSIVVAWKQGNANAVGFAGDAKGKISV